MNKSFGIRLVLVTMMALAVAVVGCKDDPPQEVTGGSGGDGGMGGMGGMAALSVSADPATTTFGTLGAITTDTIDVELTASDAAATIYYTTDATEVEVPGAGGAGGSGGMAASTTMEYAAAITIDANTVLKFLAVAADGTESEEQVEGYTYTPDAESAQWAQSGHGEILAEAWRHWDEDGEVDADDPGDEPAVDGCARCHAAAQDPLRGILQTVETGANADPAPLAVGLDCVACHSTMTTYPEIEPVEFPSGLTATFTEGGGDTNLSNLCMMCHQGRYSKVQVDEAIALGAGGAGGAGGSDGGLSFLNIHYYAAGATLFGTDVKGGYEYDELGAGGAGGTITPTYVGRNTFPSHPNGVLNDCLECHMNANDDGKHLFVPAITTCGGVACHGSATEWNELDVLKPNYDNIQTLLTELLPLIETYADTVIGVPIVYATGYPYWCNDNGNPCRFDNPYTDFDATLLKAAYNYQTAQKDPYGYIHNGDYIQQLLHDSITDLGGTSALSRP